MKQKPAGFRTSDYLDFDQATALVRKLYRDGEYRKSLLIGCGIFFGLRISDLLTLTWKMLLSDEGSFTVYEKKTNKRRTVKVNTGFKEHIEKCHQALGIKDDSQFCFLSQKGTVFSIQRVNVILKGIRKKYNLKVDHFSTHSLRKTFGRQVFSLASSECNGELALVKLSQIFNHSNTTVTRIYLGIRQEELLETYDMLNF